MDKNYALTTNLGDHAATVLKESLRGVRHVILYIRGKFLSLFGILPNFVAKPVDSVTVRVDNIAERFDRRTSKVVHKYLDPSPHVDPRSLTLAQALEQDDPYLFAKNTYDNMKIVVPYISEQLSKTDQYFISEFFAACSFRRAMSTYSKLKTNSKISNALFSYTGEHFELAGHLTHQLIKLGVIRTKHSVNAVSSADSLVNRVASLSCFAVMLYLLISRKPSEEREDYLLLLCCDLSLNVADEIMHAKGNPAALGKMLQQNAALI